MTEWTRSREPRSSREIALDSMAAKLSELLGRPKLAQHENSSVTEFAEEAAEFVNDSELMVGGDVTPEHGKTNPIFVDAALVDGRSSPAPPSESGQSDSSRSDASTYTLTPHRSNLGRRRKVSFSANPQEVRFIECDGPFGKSNCFQIQAKRAEAQGRAQRNAQAALRAQFAYAVLNPQDVAGPASPTSVAPASVAPAYRPPSEDEPLGSMVEVGTKMGMGQSGTGKQLNHPLDAIGSAIKEFWRTEIDPQPGSRPSTSDSSRASAEHSHGPQSGVERVFFGPMLARWPSGGAMITQTSKP